MKNNRTFIIASTGDRANGLKRLLISLIPYFDEGWKAVVVAQKYDVKVLKDVCSIGGNNIIVKTFDRLIGAHTAKVVALNAVESDIWCSMDDDMFAIPKTDYGKMAEILLSRKEIGFLSGNWAKTVRQAYEKEQIDEFIAQKLVFTGGGLMFREDVAQIIRGIPNEQYLFDDCLWAMYAYINGYDNFRYRGSIAVHQICTNGGRKTWLKTTASKKTLPPAEYLRVRESKDAEGYHICTDGDLTDLAHKLHKERKCT